MKERRLKEPEVLRQNWERSVYGVAKEDFNYSHCAICGSTKRLSIDHCHTTGDVRGLLCNKCNFGISYFSDDVSLLQKAIEYLSSPPKLDV
ncbi:endonuclease domain-containing protein [Acinetobacter zhairhuonensis]|uniref:endonuclease domain-containing protein n=1 Tax=Acinetobacter sp. A7.4 TaxID=2919921 RepID=UPI001F4F52C4|nr:endonuclease domain-containing protein [Acinetobacter sp. A7.4]MCJ8163147.1 endonuclease VII domain-containing protein [Acinetobacter sp. A7.4]